LLTATLLAAPTLLATASLFLAIAIALLAATLLAATALLVTITIALLAATLLAALLFGTCRSDRFVRIALCFHWYVSLLLTGLRTSWRDLCSFSEIALEGGFGLGNFT
jgi:hypothetical protein